MAIWRPDGTIRVKVIGLARSNGRLLAAEVEDDGGRVKGVRPLGGSVEFGETREQALHREFREELGTAIRISGPWHAFENIFVHEGVTGHEMIFAADVELADATLEARAEIVFAEHDGARCKARWFSPGEIAAEKLELYPTGLGALLDRPVTR